MDGVNIGSTKLKELRLRNRVRPSTLVIVPTNSCDWRYGRQLRKYFGVANIAAMDNTIATLQERRRLWSQQSMGVRDDAKSCHGILCATN